MILTLKKHQAARQKSRFWARNETWPPCGSSVINSFSVALCIRIYGQKQSSQKGLKGKKNSLSIADKWQIKVQHQLKMPSCDKEKDLQFWILVGSIEAATETTLFQLSEHLVFYIYSICD